MGRESRPGTLIVPVAFCLFVSGTGSLMLEVVWSRLLKLVFGSTTLAIATILVAYMLGLGIGGLLGGRYASRFRNGVRAYAVLEIGIALYALAVPAILDLYPLANRALFSSLTFWPAALGRFALALVVLLLPTILMGATLPVLVQAVARDRGIVGRGVGLLYGVNTLGAVCGVVLSTFVLFPMIGLRWTNVAGASADLLAGLAALVLIAPRLVAAGADEPAQAVQAPDRMSAVAAGQVGSRWNLALVSYGLVGFTSLTYEVAWTRALSMVCGSSIYAFATMLAAFLAGIALGSLAARSFVDRLRRPLAAYGLGLALLGVLSLVTLFVFRSLPDLFLLIVGRFGISSTTLLVSTIVLSFIAMLGPTLILGALFPLLTKGITVGSRAASSTVGDVYFVNTLGSAAGAFAAGFILMPQLGLRWTMVISVIVNFATAALVLAWQKQSSSGLRRAGAVVALAAAALLAIFPPAWRSDKFAAGPFYNMRLLHSYGIEPLPMIDAPTEELLYYEDGLNTTVSIHRSFGLVNMRVNGKVDASIGDMTTQVVSAHVPLLFGPPAESALVIGYASGVTVGSATLHDSLKTIDVVELEHAIIRASSWFEQVNHEPLDDPRVEVIVDDGRSFLGVTDRKYDVVISEPSNPWITGASNLFTQEFIRSVRERLTPDGRLLQWIQLYGMDPAGVQSVFAAVRAEFPHVYGFRASKFSGDLLLLATLKPLEVDDFPRWEQLSPAIRDDLQWATAYSTAHLWSLLRHDDEDTRAVAALAPQMNTDDSMYVELRAPWWLYEGVGPNEAMLGDHAAGVLGWLENGEPSVATPELLGAISIAYLRNRFLRDRAEAALALGRERGEAATLLVAEALLLDDEATGFVPRLDVFERAVELDDASCETRLYRAPRLLQAGQAAAALADLERARDLCPADPRIEWGRMRALATLGRFDEALAVARPILDGPLAVTEPDIGRQAAFLAAEVGDLEEAARLLREYLARHPYRAEDWEVLSRMHADRGDGAASFSAKQNTSLAQANEVRTAHSSGVRALRERRYEAAVEALRWVLQFEPGNERARRELAQAENALAAPASP